MSLRQQTIWLIVAAIPTIILATLAICIILRFLAVRDQLGTWDITFVDLDGTVGGHGEIDLVVEDWSVRWAPSLPFVTFIPTLAPRSSNLNFEANAATRYGDRALLVRPQMMSSGEILCGVMYDDPHRHGEIVVDLHSHPPTNVQSSPERREATARFRW
jgi:hypothetical protein